MSNREDAAMGHTNGTNGSGDRFSIEVLTPEVVASWKAPPFQRPLTVNARVMGLVPLIQVTGRIPGTLTVGILDGEMWVVEALMGLSASGHYRDWLVGRSLTEDDRSPAYGRIRAIFKARLKEDFPGMIIFPDPAWGVFHPRRTAAVVEE